MAGARVGSWVAFGCWVGTGVGVGFCAGVAIAVGGVVAFTTGVDTAVEPQAARKIVTKMRENTWIFLCFSDGSVANVLYLRRK